MRILVILKLSSMLDCWTLNWAQGRVLNPARFLLLLLLLLLLLYLRWRKRGARHEMQRWELERHIKTCREQQHVYFCILCLLFILCEERKTSENLTFILKQILFCRMFVLLLERDRSVIRSHQALIRFNNNAPWLARTIYITIRSIYI